ncbi:TPA: hypothetical protein UPI89_002023 [Listeria monocytogenes]|nr:hypothetical protein [Listeria monocytogenes]
MRVQTVTTHVECDICGKSKDKGFSIYLKRVAVLEIGCINEYGHFLKDIGKNIEIKPLDLCKTCDDMANDRIIKSTSGMFTEKVCYSFQDVEEVSE